MTMSPRRRSIGSAAACAVAATILAASTGSSPPAAAAGPQGAEPPNVLIIVTDDQRADLMAAMPKTQKWLGEGGTTFSHAFTSDPLCCPARASIFTGRYIHNHQVKRIGQVLNLDHETTMQRYLTEPTVGYHTGLIGKYFISWDLSEPPPYFEHFALGAIGVGSFTGNYYGGRWNLNGVPRHVDAYSTDFIRRRSLDFIDAAESTDDERPWLLYAAPAAPHDPTLAAKRHQGARVPAWEMSPAIFEQDRSDKPEWVQARRLREGTGRWMRQRQMRTLMAVDEMVDALMRSLREHGEARNTLVFFTTDNGWTLGEHGARGKGNPYTESIRIPFMARWPGHIPKDVVDDRLVSLVDIAPTVLEAAGIAPDPDKPMDGRSLLSSERDHVLIEFEVTNKDRGWASVRSDAVQYVEYYDQAGEVLFRELYDLVTDPWQLTNLLQDGDDGNDAEVEAQADFWAGVLAADKSCVGPSCP